MRNLVSGDFSGGGTVALTDVPELVVSFDGTGSLSGEVVCP